MQTSLLNVVPGDVTGEYIVLANMAAEPTGLEDDADPRHCCLLAVTSTPEALRWRVSFSMPGWGCALARLSPSTLFIGNADGDVIRVVDGTHQIILTGLPGGIDAIAGNSEVDCWLAHEGGLSHWEREACTTHNVDTGTLYSVHFAHPDFGVAVGDGGAVLRFDGTRWQGVASPAGAHMLTEVYCVSDKEIYICGWNGTLYRWDGGPGWTKIDLVDHDEVVTAHLYSVIAYQGEIYACAGAEGLFRIDGKVARRIQDFLSFRSAVAGGKLLLTGATSFVEYDGTAWKQLLIDIP